jgi:hypothetical protein
LKTVSKNDPARIRWRGQVSAGGKTRLGPLRIGISSGESLRCGGERPDELEGVVDLQRYGLLAERLGDRGCELFNLAEPVKAVVGGGRDRLDGRKRTAPR